VPRPLAPAKLDHAIQLYLAGEPVQKIPAATGVSLSCFHRERIARGIPSRKRLNLPTDAIVAAYNAGASEYAIARQYGVSRETIANRLTELGVERRGTSEAGLVRAAQMTPAERKAQAASANRTIRLRNLNPTEKFRRALTAEARGVPGSDGEELLRSFLKERGVTAIPQRAVGPHNVDLALPPVAVEVLGGGWHSVKTHHAERSPYILDEGWHLVMVWNYEGVSALGPGAADYLVTFAEQVRRNPPATCQYRVITGQGQVLATFGREDNQFPLVPPPRGGLSLGA
jgi:very-short-patch-repair endonuclease